MISEANIRQIKRDLESAGIDYLPLQQELIDHICTDIENNIKNGKDFKAAYLEIKQQYLSGQNLAELQNDTKNLLDYKSLFLKKMLIIVTIITVIGFSFKILRISGGNVIQFSTFLLLCVLFFKVGFYFFQDKRNPYLKKLYAICFFVLGMVLPVIYYIFSFQPGLSAPVVWLNILSYLLLSLVLGIYLLFPSRPNIFGITSETRMTDLLIALINICLATVTLFTRITDNFLVLHYLLFINLGVNIIFSIFYISIRQKFKNKLTSLLVVGSIIIHIYHLPFFIHQILN